MKDDISPIWEDPRNINGGCWSFKVQEEQSEELWEDLSVYLVTNKRAISIQTGSTAIIRSYLPGQLQDIYRKERSDGTGDVIITLRKWKDSDGDQRSEEIGFLGVRNAQEIERLLKQLAQNSA